MTSSLRNFLKSARITAVRSDKANGMSVFLAKVFELRSLPGVFLDAIPRRFSSSSLPPLFVSGRFAVFFYTGGRQQPVERV
ncbi:MAG TPA: hypothetical protein PKC60_01940 [Hydrogenophaga sp.]|uniref:hypothetical protein n=1 Tax=Hydrogenophaga sp. TaxID=1904254 RepID=UPI002C7D0BA1|nr:hypothetical protein [Hydrogenophaga sp.]HMN91967.1 hypothetical protein [Hydrogenophaga sp.]HMP08769.1 hypothetical protein [Hydrogenophaga sp.]